MKNMKKLLAVILAAAIALPALLIGTVNVQAKEENKSYTFDLSSSNPLENGKVSMKSDDDVITLSITDDSLAYKSEEHFLKISGENTELSLSTTTDGTIKKITFLLYKDNHNEVFGFRHFFDGSEKESNFNCTADGASVELVFDSAACTETYTAPSGSPISSFNLNVASSWRVVKIKSITVEYTYKTISELSFSVSTDGTVSGLDFSGLGTDEAYFYMVIPEENLGGVTIEDAIAGHKEAHIGHLFKSKTVSDSDLPKLDANTKLTLEDGKNYCVTICKAKLAEGVYYVEETNAVAVQVPLTGDDAPVLSFMAMLLISALGLTFLCLKRKDVI